MKEFEKNVQTMIESIKSRPSQNEFQKKLKEEIKLISSLKNIFFQQIRHNIFMKSRKKIMKKKKYVKVSQRHTKKLIYLYQKGLTEKQKDCKNFWCCWETWYHGKTRVLYNTKISQRRLQNQPKILYTEPYKKSTLWK